MMVLVISDKWNVVIKTPSGDATEIFLLGNRDFKVNKLAQLLCYSVIRWVGFLRFFFTLLHSLWAFIHLFDFIIKLSKALLLFVRWLERLSPPPFPQEIPSHHPPVKIVFTHIFVKMKSIKLIDWQFLFTKYKI